MTPAEVLNKAADYMEEHGKCKERYLDDRGRVCALGALRLSVGVPPKAVALGLLSGATASHEVYHGAVRALYEHMRGSDQNITYWSDTHDKRTVVRTMRRVARELSES